MSTSVPAGERAAITAAPDGLDSLLGTAPTFAAALRGYDRMQVDNYVAWAEGEMDLARRQADHLLNRFAFCSAELQATQRRLERLAHEYDTAGGRGRAEEELARAREQVAAMTADAVAEAEAIVAGARSEADARLAKVAAMRAAAQVDCDRARVEAHGMLRQAAEELAEARRAAAAVRGEAAPRRAESAARADVVPGGSTARSVVLAEQEAHDRPRRSSLFRRPVPH